MENEINNLNEESLEEVVGGKRTTIPSYARGDLMGHFGPEVNKYDVDGYIGKKVIVRFSGVHYYVGIAVKSEERNQSWDLFNTGWGSRRTIQLKLDSGDTFEVQDDSSEPRYKFQNLYLYV